MKLKLALGKPQHPYEVYQLSSGVLRTLTNDYDVHYLHPSEADI